jgi:hypothetical protein
VRASVEKKGWALIFKAMEQMTEMEGQENWNPDSF